MHPRAFIVGLAGHRLGAGERAFLRDAGPWGLILFARNINTPAQVRALIDEFRDALGRSDAPVLIDQEGGRVQRLGPPHWPKYPPGAAYGRLFERDANLGMRAARLGGRLIAADLAALGVTIDCLPVADMPIPGSDGVIGDRAYGSNVETVARVAAAIAEGLQEGGVLPVLKHIPGHGRARVDSHHALPAVSADRSDLEATDFAAFRRLASLPLAMTAHVVFTAIDPVAPATISATIVREVIRGSIGFDGLLMTDDVSMEALSGTLRERAGAAIAAGCDVVLHCNGQLDEMQAIAAAVPRLDGDAHRRAAAALAARRPAPPIDVAAARKEFSAMLAGDPAVGTPVSS
jgi:beta-N-acetylhexosaminidase